VIKKNPVLRENKVEKVGIVKVDEDKTRQDQTRQTKEEER
jgi:hypothetical protein